MNLSFLQGYATNIKDIINLYFIPALIAIAFVTFLWGIYKYFIQGADNEEAQKKGKAFALYGIIGLVIIFSVWGIVSIFMGTLGLGTTSSPQPPTIWGSVSSASNIGDCTSKSSWADCTQGVCTCPSGYSCSWGYCAK